MGLSSLSKNQKKRARKKAKKESSAEDREGAKEAVVESERPGEKEKVSRGEAKADEEVVKDPVAEIKRRIEEAKANKVWSRPYIATSLMELVFLPRESCSTRLHTCMYMHTKLFVSVWYMPSLKQDLFVFLLCSVLVVY